LLHQFSYGSTFCRRQVCLLSLPEDGDQVSDSLVWKVQVIDPDATALAAADQSLTEPNLPEATRSWNEVA